MPESKLLNRRIESLNDVEHFAKSLINAIGDITKEEAVTALEQAFKEFRVHFEFEWSSLADEIIGE